MMVMIDPEIKEKIDRKLKFYPCPPAMEVSKEIRSFINTNEGFGKRLTFPLAVGYLRHKYTNWLALQYRLQEYRIWSVREHHEIRRYVDEKICRTLEHHIPWDLN